MSLKRCCAQAELSGLDLGGLPQSAKEVELRRAQEHAEIRARQRLWAERGACALAAAEDMPDELGHGGRYYFLLSSCHHKLLWKIHSFEFNTKGYLKEKTTQASLHLAELLSVSACAKLDEQSPCR